MTIEQLRKIHQAQPFRPFTLRLADGNEYAVKHPEFLSFSVSGRTIVVATPDDSHEVIDLLLVASIHLGNGKNGKPRQRMRK